MVSRATRARGRASVPAMAKRDADVVWSSSDGDLRRARPSRERATAPAGGRVKVRRETSGRRGKTVTTVAGVPVDDAGLRELAGRLKKRCGVGGSAKDGVIELQGDHREAVVEVLRADGYDVVLAGG
jgi:translation initiation factor 1